MAMINCNECGKSVSDRASACPACGAPIASGSAVHVRVTRTGAKWEGVGFGLVALGMVAMMAGTSWGAAIFLAGFVVFVIGRFK